MYPLRISWKTSLYFFASTLFSSLNSVESVAASRHSLTAFKNYTLGSRRQIPLGIILQSELILTQYRKMISNIPCLLYVMTNLIWRKVHQQNLLMSLGASGSSWELSDQNPRVVNSQSWLDQCHGLQVHLEALAKNLCRHRRLGNNYESTWMLWQRAW